MSKAAWQCELRPASGFSADTEQPNAEKAWARVEDNILLFLILTPWFHSLDPTLRKRRWTEHEDCILLESYAQISSIWRDIARLIPGR